MKNSVCFIVPHFGKLQSYFQLFLKSCSWNKDYHWLIITDDDAPYQYPDNVKKVRMTFGELKELIQSKFDFNVSIERPYKLCDYRPFYGHIFAEWLDGFSHWGHCDTDTIMGCLSAFISDEMLDEYDKIFQLGHLAIYKNTEEINLIGLCAFQGREVGKEILQNPMNCWFDEEWDPDNNISVNKVLECHSKRIYLDDLSLNISFSYNRFRRGKFVGVENTPMPYGFEIEKFKDALYCWDKGHLLRFYMDKKNLIREEFPYIHLQKRPMKLDVDVLDQERFQIIPDAFIPLSVEVKDIEDFKSIPRPCHSRITQKAFIRRVKNYLLRRLGLQ